MRQFIHEENLKRFRERLTQEGDPIKREQIEKLLREELDREVDPPKDVKHE